MRDRLSEKDDRTGKTPEPAPSERSLESLERAVQSADARIRELEAENEQLRAARTRAMLEASRAEKASVKADASPTNTAKHRFEALTESIRIADAARSEAATERKSAILAVEDALRQEYAQRVRAIEESHAADLASVERNAAAAARDSVATELDLLKHQSDDARHKLAALKLEQEATIARREQELTDEYDRRISALERDHQEKLAELDKLKQEQFAEQLMESLSSAHVSWRTETAKKLRKAKAGAHRIAARDIDRWKRRNRNAVRRAVRVLRSRHRRRLTQVEQDWRAVHREAVQRHDAHWRTKFERLKRQARREPWPAIYWKAARQRLLVLTRLYARLAEMNFRRREFHRPAPLHAGIMAALLVFIGVNFSLTAALPTEDREQTVAVASLGAPVPGKNPRDARTNIGDRVGASATRISTAALRPAPTHRIVRERLEARLHQLRIEGEIE